MVKSVLTDEQAHHERMLRNAAEKVLGANALLEVRVIAARQGGCSWYLVGRALNISRQAAQERFGKLPEIADIVSVRSGDYVEK